MKRVLILANNDVGLYKFRKELIQELVKKYEVYVSLPDGGFIPQLKEIGCKFIDTSISRRGTNPITDFKLLMNYKRIIKEVKPDVVLTYTIKPNIYGGLACKMSGVPYIANITGLGTAVENGGLLQKITLFLYRSALKKARCVFFQNKENQEFFIKEKIIKGDNRLIPGSGVNLDYYMVLDYPSDEVVNFLFIARVMKEKGIENYLDAAEYIKKKYPKTAFHILGFCEQDYENKLREMQDRGIIKYHGMQSDVREFHKFSHCTIHPTYYPEGMSNVLLETAACGRPIITTNRSGCREIIDNGLNGYIVEQQNSKDLIEKIESFLNLNYEDKEKMGISGRVKVEKEFNREIIVDSYVEKIEEILR
ncbi:TPA: glycosyltransferase family 4 protein [Bacillus cereus]|uniref:glycosyltransferase family 4 protein n=1 Tax=Bacillus cereus group TaxID=86661 RepID=UPI001925E670|nr:glycosyltransferase family 4 protein [Bacillus cereus]MBL3877498.1 glycosyltransferase family 4 protein [Bacillus cereus]BCD08158.1 glycosyl transferase [Bacillus cereus]HDR7976018.1 glycosyltransferase family 4 protein [Bacillus cereus]HDR8074022.1 glycosyltransferase family 4 protein [Bacillus cereus]HDR8204180.1 glycosyltransferase family 4 protein [Bacillus cereus]